MSDGCWLDHVFLLVVPTAVFFYGVRGCFESHL